MNFPNFQIQMMNYSKPESGKALYERLLREADFERKSKKRGNVSGVHQYLYMIDIDKPQGVVEDCNGQIISYPPLTNCNVTKVCYLLLINHRNCEEALTRVVLISSEALIYR